ncbi:HAF repeat-containing protein [Pseudoduganella sp. SL102]|uniref:HAF repeat-containing protein n=1 Tax=Pseudoduganella sp. SL102 TaxID=2995154 RepID=UPI00248B2ED3|nr:HAF repeat-containing protein [Pseudoduganella sp. SL102]WBS04765.1 HAF repeat-containing protein [Pseudoduganella sp. SL102]
MRNISFLLAVLVMHGAAMAQAGFGERRVEQSLAADINPAGLTAGEIRTEDGQRRAVVYHRGQVTDLGTLGGTDSYATGINSAGTVTGGARNGNNRWRAFRWQPATASRQEGMQDLGTLGGEGSLGIAINQAGQIAGYADVEDGSFHAFVHDGARMKDLGTLGGLTSYATGINNSGTVVGAAQLENGYRRAFVWTPTGGMRDLGTLGGRVSVATAINDTGMVVGASETADRQWHAFLHDGTKMIDLGAMIAQGQSYATGINAAGDVAGTIRFRDNAPLTFVYKDGRMRIHPNRNGLYETAKITDDGKVVGAHYTGHRYQAFAMPSTIDLSYKTKSSDYVLLALLVLMVGWCVRKGYQHWRHGVLGKPSIY